MRKIEYFRALYKIYIKNVENISYRDIYINLRNEYKKRTKGQREKHGLLDVKK